MLPAYYAVQGFGYDKPAHTPCTHLTTADRCAIHSERAARGFSGCVGFDCYGAGQRVTEELSGMSWRSSRENAARISSAYDCYLALHRLMAALAFAEAAASAELAAPLRAKREQLDELCRTDDARAGRLDIASLRAETASLLQETVGRVRGGSRRAPKPAHDTLSDALSNSVDLPPATPEQ